MCSGIEVDEVICLKIIDISCELGIPSAFDLGIENTDIVTAPGVELNSEQKVIIGSVLDVSFLVPKSCPGELLKADDTCSCLQGNLRSRN